MFGPVAYILYKVNRVKQVEVPAAWLNCYIITVRREMNGGPGLRFRILMCDLMHSLGPVHFGKEATGAKMAAVAL